MLDTPEKIGKYEITEVIGKGSMGVVYKGHDSYVDRTVAIKVATNADADADAQSVAKRLFINETRSVGRLDHPNILKVYEAGEDQGLPYMVMEYVSGGDTLRAYCKAPKLLPIKRVCELIQQVAEALDYAHGRGVLHRDIKPANVMLTESGEAKLGDFGIARRMGADQSIVLGWFGSPLYMSPEQAQDMELTAQSDLFSLGSVFYEMLTGSPPFSAKGLSSLIQRVVNEEPVPLPEIRPEVTESLWRIVKKMLFKDLAGRYQTGGEIARDLGRVLREFEHSATLLTDEEKIQRLQQVTFFSALSTKELKDVLKAAEWRRFAAGDPIYSIGENDDAFYVVVDGNVELREGSIVLNVLGPGECFGELEYLEATARAFAAVAVRDVVLVRVERDYKQWASLPAQVKLSKTFQEVLVRRLRLAYVEKASNSNR